MNKVQSKKRFFLSQNLHFSREIGTGDQETVVHLKITCSYGVEKLLPKMPPLLPNVKSLILRKGVIGSLGKKKDTKI